MHVQGFGFLHAAESTGVFKPLACHMFHKWATNVGLESAPDCHGSTEGQQRHMSQLWRLLIAFNKLAGAAR